MAQPIPISGFLDAMSSWLHAIRDNKHDAAVVEVERIRIFARLLSEDREFAAMFNQRRDDPQRGRDCHRPDCDLRAFLAAVTEASRPGRFRAASHGHS